MTVRLILTDARDGTTKREIPAKNRKGLFTTTQVPAGDFDSGCQVDCALVATWDSMPALGSKWEVYDTDFDPDNPVWGGVLVDDDREIKKRRLSRISLSAKGYYHSGEWQSFRVNQVYGPSESPTNTVTDQKETITDIVGAITHAVTQLDQYVTVPTFPDSGINIRTDSQSFSGNNAVSVLNWAAGLTSFLATPFIWQIYFVAGLPTLHWAAMETAAFYFDDGLSEWSAKYSLQDIVNDVTVEWGNSQRWNEPYDSMGTLSGPLEYVSTGGVNLIKSKYVNAGEDLHNLDDVKALAAGYLAKFNQLIASGNVKLTKPVRTTGFSNKTPIIAIRSGHVINLAQPDNYPYEQIEHYVTSTRWEEDSCTCQLNIGTLNGVYTEMRRLVLLPNSNFVWGSRNGSINTDTRDLRKIRALGTISTSSPSDSLPIVRPVFPVGVFSDADHSYSGTEEDVGGTLVPEIVPKRYFNFNQQIKMADDSVVAVGDDVAGLFSENFLMKGWYIASLKPSGTNVSATVRIKKNGTAIPGAVATLSSAQQGTGTITPFQVAAGDLISFDVLTNDASKFLVVTPYGQQDYPEYPHYGAPTP